MSRFGAKLNFIRGQMPPRARIHRPRKVKLEDAHETHARTLPPLPTGVIDGLRLALPGWQPRPTPGSF